MCFDANIPYFGKPFTELTIEQQMLLHYLEYYRKIVTYHNAPDNIYEIIKDDKKLKNYINNENKRLKKEEESYQNVRQK